MKENAITENNISKLVHDFYKKIRADEQLGPIFKQAIGEYDDEWTLHLQRMVDFWSSIMLTSGRYHGKPFQKHAALPSFDINLFDRWLTLFTESACELYIQPIADIFIEKSQRIAENLKYGLYHKPEFPII